MLISAGWVLGLAMGFLVGWLLHAAADTKGLAEGLDDVFEDEEEL